MDEEVEFCPSQSDNKEKKQEVLQQVLKSRQSYHKMLAGQRSSRVLLTCLPSPRLEKLVVPIFMD